MKKTAIAATISNWLDQAKVECDQELELLLAELQAQEREGEA